MATLSPLVTGVPVEGVYFPPVVKPPGSTKPFFLAGAGYRGGHLNGIYVKATTTGVYLEDNAIPWLAAKWKGKTAQQLWESDEFYEDIVKGPFEKFFHLRNILPLTGKDFSEKVAGNMAAIIKAAGVYSDREAKAIEKFVDIYKDKFLPVGHSSLYTQSPTGSLAIAFSNDGSIPEECGVVIENKPVSEVLLNSIIGKNGVSPTAKQSLAERLSQILKQNSEGFEAKKK